MIPVTIGMQSANSFHFFCSFYERVFSPYVCNSIILEACIEAVKLW